MMLYQDLYMCIHVCIYIYRYMYICIYIYTCIYICTYTSECRKHMDMKIPEIWFHSQVIRTIFCFLYCYVQLARQFSKEEMVLLQLQKVQVNIKEPQLTLLMIFNHLVQLEWLFLCFLFSFFFSCSITSCDLKLRLLFVVSFLHLIF